MDKNKDTRMPLTSQNIVAERIEALRQLFPEAFTEGSVDFAKLKQALGEFTDDSPERYGLSWAGKSDAIRAVQSLSSGTLVPCKEESVNFDTTENLIIEGDNLEVLKLLQKSYYGKVKMIYIDPPYNTGNEFIYPDNFREGMEDYLKYSGQVSDEGFKVQTNTETSGRFHSKWLNMMYPRLFLARNLLREDGLIFVSIDDNEIHDLRSLMNEIFGEENFVACIVWQKRTSPDARASLGAAHDYIICFSKSLIEAKNSLKLLPLSDIRAGDYKNPDNDPRGAWASVDLTGQTGHATPSQYYEISLPAGERIKPPEGRCWAIAEETFKRLVAEGRIWFGKDGKARPRLKRFLSEAEGSTAWTWWSNAEVGHNQEGTKELIDIMGAADVFTNPKPTRLIKRMLQLTTSPETYDIILDFFAGSGTTADAVMQINNEEDGNRRFILIQLPEKAPEDSMARIAGYQHIAAICRERVRRVAERIDTEARERLDFSNGNSQDRGFKALQLTSSNFKLWNADEAPKDADGLAEQLRLYADHIMPGRSQEDILHELLLKAGLPLTARVEEKELAGQKVFSVDDGRLVICLEDDITHETLREMMGLKPEMALCLDSAFKGNDQLKTNIVLEMESHEIKFHTV